MLKPTRTILALTAGNLVLGLVGAGTAVAAGHPVSDDPGRAAIAPADGDGFGRDDYDGYARGVVVSKGSLAVRSRPTTHSQKVGRVYPHEKLAIACKERGERVDGNNIWYLLEERDRKDFRDEDRKGAMNSKAGKYDDDSWVSARYVKNLGKVEYCRS
ncbi:SH3 domain-containing protein [Streptomyces sp. TBY4]|uniref:SH3 domain-containing protein n=1 Tax=Streptomyces sp. TBY4 TaxID=2962030 RepID=UPI0020B68FD2|nr:SH3 domain-containing protein [Streptomyces sp. TBY4]MCP3753485.1 SH3 domain-containing protein [Streptomyces sp. TBY4]